MKNFKKLTAMLLVVLTVCTLCCAMTVSAEDGKYFNISHINDDSVFANAAVIYTKKYFTDNNYAVLGDVTAGYKAKMGDKVAAVDPDWASVHVDHKFQSYYAMACQWNEENARYEVVQTETGGSCGSIVCPENGFILAIHCDRDIPGKTPHNYPSTEFAVTNLGKSPALGGTFLVNVPTWSGYLNQPVYLYNIDLEAGTIVTTGTFESKMSEKGIAAGLTEVFEGFSTESTLYIGEENANATVDAFEPSNITVSFSKIEALQKEYSEMFQPDYDDVYWANLNTLFNKYSEEEKANLTNKDVSAWAAEIREMLDNPVMRGEDSPEVINPGNQSGGQVTGNKNNKNNNGFPIWIIFVVLGVLVLGGGAFLVIALTKGKKTTDAPVAAEETPAEEAKEETKEETAEDKE